MPFEVSDRVLNACDPRYFIQHQDSAIEKFELILKKFLEKKWLTATKCDILLQQYRVWLKEEGDTDANACQSFDPKKERLDSFMHEKMGSREHLNELWEFTKMVLILSHGQSSIERGFSTNNKSVDDNMVKIILEAFRRVYDGLKQYQMDLADIPISKKMLETCRGARTRYQQHLDEEKKKKAASQTEIQKQALKDEIKAEKGKKRLLESSIDVLTKEADELAKQAENENGLVGKVKCFQGKSKRKKERNRTSRGENKACRQKTTTDMKCYWTMSYTAFRDFIDMAICSMTLHITCLSFY